jgi:hypothetical protein
MKRVSTLFHCDLDMGFIQAHPNEKQRLCITITSNGSDRSVLLNLETAKALQADLEEKIKELENQQQWNQ